MGGDAGRLKTQIEVWCSGILSMLRDARPQLPEEMTDRQQDGAEPLLAIADLAGGEWPQAARRALIELCADARAADSSIGVQLLNDIRVVFESKGLDRLSSTELAAALAEIETSPWGEWSHGKPLTAAKLARLLSPYGITPHNIRMEGKVPKGYELEGFRDAFERYLRLTNAPSDVQSATPLQAASAPFVSSELASDSGDCSKRYKVENAAAPKCQNINETAPCSGVAVSRSPSGMEEEL